MDESYNTIPKYREQLKSLSGVDILDKSGQFRATYDIIKDLSDVWGTLDSQAQAAITTMVAGVRQQNVFGSLLSQFKEAEGVMAALPNAGGAMAEAYTTYSDSVEAAVNRIDTAFQSLSTTLVSSGAATGFIDFGAGVVNVLNGIVSAIGPLSTAIAGFGIYKLIKNFGEPKSTGFMVPIYGKEAA